MGCPALGPDRAGIKRGARAYPTARRWLKLTRPAGMAVPGFGVGFGRRLARAAGQGLRACRRYVNFQLAIFTRLQIVQRPGAYLCPHQPKGWMADMSGHPAYLPVTAFFNTDFQPAGDVIVALADRWVA